MCSIAGLHSARVQNESFLQTMLTSWHALLQHRGPDDWGWYRCKKHHLLLFNTRLAITGVENGRQPLTNRNGAIWLTFNGEIYNHEELKKTLEDQGYPFHTLSDGEVIIHLYEKEGIKAINRLAGEFAFALYDASKAELLLVRDRFGIKPLYYAQTPANFYFGSEIKAVFADGNFCRRFDEQTLQNHLQTFFFDTETIFADVCQIPPGHYLRYNLLTGATHLSAYWTLPVGEVPTKAPEKDQVDQFRHLLRKAVQRRIPAEVPFGVYLSGGLDSSAITCILADLYQDPFPVFSIGFDHDQYNELPYSKQLARHLKLPHHIVQIGKGDLKEAFLKSIWHSETPVLNTHGAAKQLLAKTAGEQVKVVLTGDGSDEILWGYSLFAHLHQQESTGNKAGVGRRLSMAEGNLSGKLRNYREVVDFFGSYPYSMQRYFLLRRINQFVLTGNYRRDNAKWNWQKAMQQHFDMTIFKGLSSAEATQLLLLRTDFPSYLLNYLGDRQEMAASLEGRVPFLDHELVEFACSLPATSKLRGNVGKHILRESLHGQLDESIRLREKKAFYAPALESIHFFEDPDFYRQFTTRNTFAEVGIFNPAFFSILNRVVRVLPKKSNLLPVAESMVVFILSLHMLHEFFIRDFEQWKQRFAPPNKRLDFSAYNMGRIALGQ